MAVCNAKPHFPLLAKWLLLLGKLIPASMSYRPERHYMRGPGPKYRERHPAPAAPRHNG